MFKIKNNIKDKLIYLKNKDIFGLDIRSSITFEFNLWDIIFFIS